MVRWVLCGSARPTSPSRRIPENAPALRHTTGGTAQRSRPLSTDDSIPFGYCLYAIWQGRAHREVTGA